MPGPCSAPNGDHKLVNRQPKENDNIRTGKTALKRGDIEHNRVTGFKKLTRKQREIEEQE